MPSLDIFCLRIFIAFSRLSRTSTSTGFPNEFSMGSDVGTRSPEAGQALGVAPDDTGCRSGLRSGHQAKRASPELWARYFALDALLRFVVLVEQRDRETVKLGVRALRDDLVDDLVIRVTANPVGDELAQEFTLFCFCRREHLHASNVNHPSF